MLTCATKALPLETNTAAVRRDGHVARADRIESGSDRDEVDELRVVCMVHSAEAGHRAGKGGRVVLQILDSKPPPLALARKSTLALPPLDVDGAAADFDDAAVDDRAADDLHQAADAAVANTVPPELTSVPLTTTCRCSRLRRGARAHRAAAQRQGRVDVDGFDQRLGRDPGADDRLVAGEAVRDDRGARAGGLQRSAADRRVAENDLGLAAGSDDRPAEVLAIVALNR